LGRIRLPTDTSWPAWGTISQQKRGDETKTAWGRDNPRGALGQILTGGRNKGHYQSRGGNVTEKFKAGHRMSRATTVKTKRQEEAWGEKETERDDRGRVLVGFEKEPTHQGCPHNAGGKARLKNRREQEVGGPGGRGEKNRCEGCRCVGGKKHRGGPNKKRASGAHFPTGDCSDRRVGHAKQGQ